MQKENVVLPNKKLSDNNNTINASGDGDNNLGPERFAGPKALDPNYCRQPTL